MREGGIKGNKEEPNETRRKACQLTTPSMRRKNKERDRSVGTISWQSISWQSTKLVVTVTINYNKQI